MDFGDCYLPQKSLLLRRTFIWSIIWVQRLTIAKAEEIQIILRSILLLEAFLFQSLVNRFIHHLHRFFLKKSIVSHHHPVDDNPAIIIMRVKDSEISEYKSRKRQNMMVCHEGNRR